MMKKNKNTESVGFYEMKKKAISGLSKDIS